MTIVTLWRIGADTPDYKAEDASGKGAEVTGGRWNRKGTAVIYAATTRALAHLETIVHLPTSGLPLKRYLVRIDVPNDVWKARTLLTYGKGWDAEPPGQDSIDAGNGWANSNVSVICAVPSVIVPEEMNVIINPNHADAKKLVFAKERKVIFDTRFGMRTTLSP